jgi:hypothetical protein
MSHPGLRDCAHGVMLTRVPNLPKGSDSSRFGGVATQFVPISEQHILNRPVMLGRPRQAR